jgi:hypothetical protein
MKGASVKLDRRMLGAIMIALGCGAAPARAQNTTTPAAAADRAMDAASTTRARGFDTGGLGLIGLVGLFGLKRRSADETRDRVQVGGTAATRA